MKAWLRSKPKSKEEMQVFRGSVLVTEYVWHLRKVTPPVVLSCLFLMRYDALTVVHVGGRRLPHIYQSALLKLPVMDSYRGALNASDQSTCVLVLFFFSSSFDELRFTAASNPKHTHHRTHSRPLWGLMKQQACSCTGLL